jgi:2,4-dienoyl-CoA reductase-like NADH-dependent reductase (Old Yellow Enzyme family)
LFDSLAFRRGPAMKNRFVLAPLTNLQSHDDGVVSDEEFRWLTMRAEGGYGMTMTCAAHVDAQGQGFAGQLGCFDPAHDDGLARLADAIRGFGSVSSLQLHHAGMRSPEDLIGARPMCPSPDEETGARGVTRAEVDELIEAFIAAAERADRAGFDGVEVHGAHGYLVCQFLSPEINRREDDFGGGLEGRARFLFDVIRGIRSRCRDDFQVGVRLSPERFGMRLEEVRTVAQRLFDDNQIDYLDLSLWDVFKEPADPSLQGRTLLSYFLDLDRGETRLGAAGKIKTAADARWCLDQGLDFVTQGRAAILHHDFPRRCEAQRDFAPVKTPVTPEYLEGEGLSPKFVDYMRRWRGFVTEA